MRKATAHPIWMLFVFLLCACLLAAGVLFRRPHFAQSARPEPVARSVPAPAPPLTSGPHQKPPPIFPRRVRNDPRGLVCTFLLGEPVKCAAFSPDGRLLACLAESGTVRVWRRMDDQLTQPARRSSAPSDPAAGSWQPLWTATFDPFLAQSLAFSPDNRLLALVGDVDSPDLSKQPDEADGDTDSRLGVLLCSTRTGSITKVLTGAGFESIAGTGYHTVAFSPDGRFLGAGQGLGTAQLWDTRTWKNIDRPVYGLLAWTRTGLVTAGGKMELRTPDGARRRRTFRDYPTLDSIISLWTCADADALVTWNTQRMVDDAGSSRLVVWNPHSGEPAWTVPALATPGESAVACLAPGGKTLATGGEDDTVWFWDLQRREATHRIAAHDDAVTALAFSPEGRLLASGSDDGTLKIWDMREVDRIPVQRPDLRGRRRTLAKDEWKIHPIALSADGKILLTGSMDGATIWNLQPGRSRRRCELVYTSALSPDGRTAALAWHDPGIRLVDTATGRRRQILRSAGDYTSANFSPGGEWFQASSDSAFYVWRTRDWEPQPLPPGAGEITFSSDDRLAAVLVDGDEIQVRRCGTWSLLRTIRTKIGQQKSVVLSPQGSLVLATGEDGQIHIWNVGTGRLTCTVPAMAEGDTPTFSGNDRLIAEATMSKTVQIRDAQTGRLLNELRGYGGSVGAMEFSPDGRVLATGNENGTIILWNPVTGRKLHRYAGPGEPVEMLRFAPGGRLVAIGSDRQRLVAWTCPVD